jgi:hypothetical protein
MPAAIVGLPSAVLSPSGGTDIGAYIASVNPMAASTVNLVLSGLKAPLCPPGTPPASYPTFGTLQPDGTWSGQLSVQPDASFQMRPVGAVGAFETFTDDGTKYNIRPNWNWATGAPVVPTAPTRAYSLVYGLLQAAS